MTITEFLKDKVPFLAGLSQEEAHELASAAEQVNVTPGQTIKTLEETLRKATVAERPAEEWGAGSADIRIWAGG